MPLEYKEHEAVTNYRKYLQIPSVHPDVNYDECVKFILDQANSMRLPVKVVTMHPGKPIVIITFVGTNPELPSILLNSHMDVVPVEREFWSYDPFAAVKDADGNIYARGAQDMKIIGIQYLETVRRYLKEGLKFKRTIHLSFVPDEETGGVLGMAKFIETEEFKKLNVGFSLDEGMPSPTDTYMLAYAERAIWQLDVVCSGTCGHGSLLHENTAAEKIHYVISKFMDFRAKEKQKLQSNPEFTVGDVTTVNLTMLQGGKQHNVLPAELRVSFDVRVAVDVDHDQLQATFEKWCKEAGDGVRLEFLHQEPKRGETRLDDSNSWWIAMKKECDKMKLKLKPVVFPGGTDSRFIRYMGIPAIGFSPINHTPNLLHAHNEYVNEKTFLEGLDIYYNILQNLASL